MRGISYHPAARPLTLNRKLKTVNSRLKVARSYFDWLSMSGYRNPPEGCEGLW